MSKYKAKPTVIDGIRFASKAEARRWGELRILHGAGLIHALITQPRYKLIVNGDLVATYVADFAYYDKGHLVVEDVKSPATMTPLYKVKRKLMKACHGIEIKEVMT